jgi:hypothetical protein
MFLSFLPVRLWVSPAFYPQDRGSFKTSVLKEQPLKIAVL